MDKLLAGFVKTVEEEGLIADVVSLFGFPSRQHHRVHMIPEHRRGNVSNAANDLSSLFFKTDEQ